MKKESAGLRVKLLGGFETRLRTGAAVMLPTRKAQALLAYLAVLSTAFEKRGNLNQPACGVA